MDAVVRHKIPSNEGNPKAMTKTILLATAAILFTSGGTMAQTMPATSEGAARLRNGNPGQVAASSVGWGDEAWASSQGRAIAVGVYRSGELHPSRVFNL